MSERQRGRFGARDRRRRRRPRRPRPRGLRIRRHHHARRRPADCRRPGPDPPRQRAAGRHRRHAAIRRGASESRPARNVAGQALEEAHRRPGPATPKSPPPTWRGLRVEYATAAPAVPRAQPRSRSRRLRGRRSRSSATSPPGRPACAGRLRQPRRRRRASPRRSEFYDAVAAIDGDVDAQARPPSSADNVAAHRAGS